MELVDDAPSNDPKVIEVTRAFLIYVAGYTFINSSHGYVKSGYLAAFNDLDLMGFYDWRSCAMACLYNSLTRVTRLWAK
ncbi:hypothetical protein MKW92_044407, partial [Papaver armeniacum]